MPRRVPFLREEQIERDAMGLLAKFERATGCKFLRTVPIEGIVEKHLKLGVEFDDMHRLLGVLRSNGAESDILGAIFIEERRILIDERLDPEENRSKEGRYRFTVAPRAAATSGCIGICSLRIRHRFHCSEKQRRLP
jgi:hypothetical protein